ncbi:MAG: autotransporter-associated beta strand repeat-containing protein [Chthoniobacteraceae bacterium]
MNSPRFTIGKRIASRILLANIVATMTSLHLASGAVYTWNTGGATDVWSTTTGNANWLSGGVEWTDGSGAVFNDATGETITISGVVSGTSFDIGANNGNWSFVGSGSIAGSGNLVKRGTGTLIISTANTYGSDTSVSTGALIVQNNTALGGTAGAVVVSTGATLGLQGGITVTGKTLTINGAGLSSNGALRNISGSNEWAGTITATSEGSGSRIQVESGSVLTLSGSLTVTGNGSSFSIINNSLLSISAVISGSGGFSIGGSGTTVITGANTYGDTSARGMTIGSGSAVVRVVDSTVYGTGNHTIAVNGLGNSSNTVTFGASTGSSILQLRANGQNDSTAQVLTYGNNLTISGASGVNGTIDVDRESGTGSNKILALGNVTTGVNGGTLHITGSNGYSLSVNNVTIGGNAKTATFDPTTANLTIANVTNSSANTGGNTLKLDGTSSGNAVTGVISDGASYATLLTKSNSSTWTLRGANTYTGATTVSGGTLALERGSLGATAVTVAAAASTALQVSGNYTIGTASGGSLTVTGGASGKQGTLSLIDGAANTLTLANNSGTDVFTIGSTTSGRSSVLNMEVGAVSDKIVVGSGASLINIQKNDTATAINIVGLGTLDGTQQTLILASGGVGTVTSTRVSFASGFTLGTVSGNLSGYTVALASDDTHLYLTETANAAPATAYWKGTIDGVWNSFTNGNTNTSNFTTDAAGTANANGMVSGSTNIVFNATGAAHYASTTLGQDLTVNSLMFSSGNAVGIGGTNTLTLNATSANGNTSGNGITVAPGAGNSTISSKIALGNDQTWTVADTATLTVSNQISGLGKALTKAGDGTLILSGTNIYTGATTVNGGTLTVNGSLAAGSAVAVGRATLAGSGTVNGTVSGSGATINGSGLTMGTTTLHSSNTLSGYNIASSVEVESGSTALTGTTQAPITVGIGATLNNGGTVIGNVSVGGLLNGNGEINGNLTLTSGTLSPGNSAGITTVNGDFVMNASSTLVAEVSGATEGVTYDQVKVSGNVSLNGTLDLSTLSGLSLGTTVTLIANTGDGTTTGYFSTIITSGSTYTVSTSSSTYVFTIGTTEYEINYAANTDSGTISNDVTLTVVPEPSTWAMIVGGIGMLAVGQRFRRRLS